LRAATALVLALALAVTLSLAQRAVAVDAAASPLVSAPSNLLSGADIYAHICQSCHMAQGAGAVGAGRFPKLAGDPALRSWEYVAITVLNGRHGMPPFGSWGAMGPLRLSIHLSDAQVAEVVNYVRTHFGNHYISHVRADQIRGLPHPADSATD
jgi:mono/diheme cytochrome c family protein